MLRRFAATALVAVLVVGVGLWVRTMTTTTVSIGSGPVTLVQTSTVVITSSSAPWTGPVAATLPAASTAGTTLIAVLGNSATGSGSAIHGTFPTGWTLLSRADDASSLDIEAWIYPDNPGGISSVAIGTTPAITASGRFEVVLSEWSNVFRTSTTSEASGTATSSAGTTLSLTTTGNVLNPGDLAIAAWRQRATGVGAVTFTTPSGWTRLADSGSDATVSGHLDVEYQIGPLTGMPLSTVLTSTGTTALSEGLIIVLEAAPPTNDQTAYLKYGSLSTKLNTADFTLVQGGYYQQETGAPGLQDRYTLEDGSGYLILDTVVPSLGDPVTITNPTWSGRVVSTAMVDMVDAIRNYREVEVAATNTTAAGAATAVGNFTDSLSLSGFYYQLESGAGNYQLEDGTGNYLLEGWSPYAELQVRTSQNQDGTTTTYGTLKTYAAGYAAGQTFQLYNTNLGIAGTTYTIQNVTQTWLGAALTGQPTPAFLIEFGDAYQTLQQAGGGLLTRTASVASTQLGVVAPGGVLGYAQVTAAQGTFTAATDLTGLTVTVTVSAGRRIEVTGFALFSSSVAFDGVFLEILEGATILATGGCTVNAINASEGAIVKVILQPTTGVHTYKLTAVRNGGTGNITMQAGATFPAFILAEDIGT